MYVDNKILLVLFHEILDPDFLIQTNSKWDVVAVLKNKKGDCSLLNYNYIDRIRMLFYQVADQ